MKIYFPSYYNKFRCKAEKCQNSCCIGWEIYVDAATLERYKTLDRQDILCHIEDGERIGLCDGERCPFLCTDGLCRLISELGDDYTSAICREHPRFYHKIGDVLEGGIGASCEEAARIILTSDGYAEFIAIEREECDVPEETELDTIADRAQIYTILADRDTPYHTRVAQIRDKYSIPEHLHTSDEWQAEFDLLELLDEGHRALIAVGKSDMREQSSPYFERFLAYLIFRHASVAESCDSLRSGVALSILLAEMLENAVASRECTEAEIIDIARIISEEIEYSEENTAALLLEIESII